MSHQLRKGEGRSRKKAAKTAGDAGTPPALVDFMMKGWKVERQAAPATVKGHARFEARREQLSRAFPGEVLVIPTGHEKLRVGDTTHRFRAGSDFFYLTGNPEPDCVLVLVPAASGHHDVLYVEPNPGRTDPTFFTDRAKGELWVGPRLGVEQSRQRYGVNRCESLHELAGFLRDLKRRRASVRVLRDVAADIDAALPARKKQDAELAAVLGEMRLVKDEMEVASIKRACAATRRAFEAVVRTLKSAATEREIEGAFNLVARVDGNDVGFSTIAAAGEHACILHWTANDGRLRKGDLLLVDAGVETNELYTADITRTLPISGRFTAAQREIYDLVVEAQDAAFAAVKPGNDFLEPHRAAARVLVRGLERLGILPMSAEEALREENQFYKRYTLHGVSHMLGLDIHDCGNAPPESHRLGTLRPGMVLTVEPGLYFQKNDLTVPTRYRGIGIRVEDDVLVTTRGCRLLSDVPRASDDVERWVRRIWDQLPRAIRRA